MRDDSSFQHRGMPSGSLLEGLGADPFATRFDHVLCAIDNVQRVVWIDDCDITSLHPTIGGLQLLIRTAEVGADGECASVNAWLYFTFEEILRAKFLRPAKTGLKAIHG